MAVAIDLSGRVALVTGGTRGIGYGIATRLAEAGATVAICARSAGDVPSDWVQCAADLRDPEAASGTVLDVVRRLGRLDVLVNNAGGSPVADTSTASPRFTERIVSLNLLAAMWCSQAAKPHLESDEVAAAGGGSIVNVASVAALRPAPTVAAYAAAKAGLVNYTRTIGQEWAPRIRSNCVAVGMVRTPDSEDHYGSTPDSERAIADGIPMGRLGTVADVADSCLFLCSPLASYVSGACLVLDGGGDRPPFLDAAER